MLLSVSIAFRAIRHCTFRRAEHRPYLQFTFVGWAQNVSMDLHEFLSHANSLFSRLQVENRITADQFLGFSEGPVNYGGLAFCRANARSLRTREQTSGGHHYAFSI